MMANSAVLHRDLHVDPHSIAEASGLYLTLSSGKKIVDATGGAAVSCIGHGDERVQKAILNQLKKVDYCHSLFFSCVASEGLARMLVDSTKGQMARAFILSSGSEAMDGAMKLARQYFLELSPPQPKRVRFIARHESYHGNTLGALSMGGHKLRRAIYEPMLSQFISRVSACNVYRGSEVNESVADYVTRLALELDEEFQRVGSDTVCAFVAETVVGATLGCVPSLPGYFAAVKAVCDKHGALLILDEVMSGMGRTGTLHAWEQEGVVPDIQTIGKGLGGGYVPIAGMLIGHRVVNTLDNGTGQFVHGQTYQGHPTACAGALEVQRIIDQDNLLNKVKTMGQYLETALKATFGNHPNVGDIRGRGLFWALEFVKDKASKEPFDPTENIAMSIHDQGLRSDPGVLLYPGRGCADGRRGDHVLVAPPYNITTQEIDLIVDGTRMAINHVFKPAVCYPQQDFGY